MDQKTIVIDFIEKIWNQKDFDTLSKFLATDYYDHSLPNGMPQNTKGLSLWIQMTSSAFEHHTSIQEILCEGNSVFIRIKMKLKHVGPWRGHAPTGVTIETSGYRLFRLKEEKIVEQWALLDADSITEAITGASHRCTLPQ